ncbi:LOW QUALITY PROTEIN: hypothetical protein SETIT_4G156000v2 [Setaria italica]|uniref:SCP domain-containing protein n=1 Tax=Setaria italica TaxID=4555 RepID=A0A368QWK5_SETIT|nr:LOW QUALITY PROTEIN: hypothetical protein SETIT_4G156000v2 [Setaria italica]
MARSNDGAATLELVVCLGLLLGHLAIAQKSTRPPSCSRTTRPVGVPKLSWNATLAAYARRYAGRRAHDCELVHSRGPYGENIFWGSASRDWAAGDAVASWVKERANYRRKCGHYTQVMARTKRVGCAAVECDGGGTFIICSHDPPGNVNGKPPYPGCGRYGVPAVQ